MNTTKRRYPKQERSKQRYEHILNTAAILFQQKGIENVTTNHIATAAGVSIGSLYQFFSNKNVIIEVLIERFLDDIDDLFPGEVDTNLPIEIIIKQVLENTMLFENTKKGFNELLLNADTMMADKMHGRLVSGAERILKLYFSDLSDEKAHLCATVSLQITKAMLMLDHLPNEILLEQMVMAISAYQRAFVANSK